MWPRLLPRLWTAMLDRPAFVVIQMGRPLHPRGYFNADFQHHYPKHASQLKLSECCSFLVINDSEHCMDGDKVDFSLFWEWCGHHWRVCFSRAGNGATQGRHDCESNHSFIATFRDPLFVFGLKPKLWLESSIISKFNQQNPSAQSFQIHGLLANGASSLLAGPGLVHDTCPWWLYVPIWTTSTANWDSDWLFLFNQKMKTCKK